MGERRRPLIDEVARRWPDVDAEAVIADGAVLVDGLPKTNPRTLVGESTSIRIVKPAVSRGYVKIGAGLDAFGIDAGGRIALDAGAAAGGFTRALLDRGAARVYAVEVGFGQLLGSLRQDPRVVNLERTNIGSLSLELVPDAIGLIVLDLGYLPLAKGVPQLNVLQMEPDCELLALVKPVTELGLPQLPSEASEESTLWDAIEQASAAIEGAGWRVAGSIESPARGSRGAVEGFIHARRADG